MADDIFDNPATKLNFPDRGELRTIAYGSDGSRVLGYEPRWTDQDVRAAALVCWTRLRDRMAIRPLPNVSSPAGQVDLLEAQLIYDAITRLVNRHKVSAGLVVHVLREVLGVLPRSVPLAQLLQELDELMRYVVLGSSSATPPRHPAGAP